MSAPLFTFTRNPSTKVSVGILQSGLVTADNDLIIIGRRGASGGSATTLVPVLISNYGDPVAAATEAATFFGASSEIGEMIVAAINANLYGGREPKQFPKIRAIAMATAATSSDLAAALAANIALPMPFVVTPFPLTDATARSALKAHLIAISASDRGINAQFGSFGIMPTDSDTATVTTAGTNTASETILSPWLRDSAGSKANKIHVVGAAFAALCAANGAPFLPLNDTVVGGLVPPVATSDFHTSGDAGTVSLGLDAGVVPLYIGADGSVKVSRSVTAYRPSAGSTAPAYYDYQDWKILYYYRQNAYAIATQPRYAVAKATDAKLLALKSELVNTAKTFEELEMFQYVDKLVSEFTVMRALTNRHAAIYGVPVNVVPGFHNKGIGLEGSTKYDSFVL